MNVIMVSVDKIIDSRPCCRDLNYDLLVDSIHDVGLMTPITVQKIAGGRYRLVDGLRRYHAYRDLGFKEISAIEECNKHALVYMISGNLVDCKIFPSKEAVVDAAIRVVYSWSAGRPVRSSDLRDHFRRHNVYHACRSATHRSYSVHIKEIQ